MVIANPHPREAVRLLALENSGVLDTPENPSLNALTRLAARLCNTPTALVSFVDKDRQWFKSRVGFEGDETPREQAICAHAILQDRPLVLPDLSVDARFVDNPLCGGHSGFRFYAGAPLMTSNGLPLGTLCVMDVAPRPQGLTPDQLQDLTDLAGQVMKLLELEPALEWHRIALKESVHRTKNAVAVASAIAARTIAESPTLEDAQSLVASRLQALSNAQSFLLETDHEGAPLRALIERQLAAFGGTEQRFSLDGHEFVVSGDAAEGIGLAIHELATNALKYGALSVPSGRVEIRWSRKEDGGLSLEWKESGGPAILAQGTRVGFGSVVVGALAAQKIGGEATLHFPPEGALWTADIAASRVVAPN